MTHPAWNRVSRSNPCPVCGRGNWCLTAADGTAAICPRAESRKRCGAAGWLHRLTDPGFVRAYAPVRRVTVAAPAPRDFTPQADEFRRAADPGRLAEFAASLGLTADALSALGVGWAGPHDAWAFPMTDPTSGRVTGIRLRRPNGRKFAVTGSRDGLFLPAGADAGGPRLVFTEGPTDAAALLVLGFAGVVGRPSCAGAVGLAVDLVRLRRPAEVVLLADADAPGREGAGRLAAALSVHIPTVRVATPPAGFKDARAWVRTGATAADVEQALSAGAATRLAVRSREVRRG